MLRLRPRTQTLALLHPATTCLVLSCLPSPPLPSSSAPLTSHLSPPKVPLPPAHGRAVPGNIRRSVGDPLATVPLCPSSPSMPWLCSVLAAFCWAFCTRRTNWFRRRRLSFLPTESPASHVWPDQDQSPCLITHQQHKSFPNRSREPRPRWADHRLVWRTIRGKSGDFPDSTRNRRRHGKRWWKHIGRHTDPGP